MQCIIAGHLDRATMEENAGKDYRKEWKGANEAEKREILKRKPLPLILHLDPLKNGSHDTKAIGHALKKWLRCTNSSKSTYAAVCL